MNNMMILSVEEALVHLNIYYRQPFEQEAFYFCNANGITFDLKIEESGEVRLWRFVDSITEEDTEYFPEWCRFIHEKTVKFTMTEDLDICLSEQQVFKDTEQNRLEKYIKEYVELITNIEYSLHEMD